VTDVDDAAGLSAGPEVEGGADDEAIQARRAIS
jgi:hypothetical protein